jgi:hypothetical protein
MPEGTTSGFPWKSATIEFTNPTGLSRTTLGSRDLDNRKEVVVSLRSIFRRQRPAAVVEEPPPPPAPEPGEKPQPIEPPGPVGPPGPVEAPEPIEPPGPIEPAE